MRKVLFILLFITTNCFAQYDEVSKFINGRAWARKGVEYTIIDTNYFERIKLNSFTDYKGIQSILHLPFPMSFNNAYDWENRTKLLNSPINNTEMFLFIFKAKVCNNYKTALIDAKSGGLIPVVNENNEVIKDKDGNAIILPLSVIDDYFNYNYFFRRAKGRDCEASNNTWDGYYLFSDTNGNLKAQWIYRENQFQSLCFLNKSNDYNNLRFSISQNNLFALANYSTELLTEYKFRFIEPFVLHDKTVALKANKKFVLIDLNGKEISEEYDILSNYVDSYAFFMNTKWENESLHRTNPNAPNKKSEIFGYIDTLGKPIVINFETIYLNAPQSLGGSYDEYIVEKGKKAGFFDKLSGEKDQLDKKRKFYKIKTTYYYNEFQNKYIGEFQERDGSEVHKDYKELFFKVSLPEYSAKWGQRKRFEDEGMNFNLGFYMCNPFHLCFVKNEPGQAAKWYMLTKIDGKLNKSYLTPTGLVNEVVEEGDL